MRPRAPIVPAPRSLRASGDRWLFGYADVVTLLFACFAALYAAQVAPAATPAILAAESAPVVEPAPPPVLAAVPTPDPAALASPASPLTLALEALAATEDGVHIDLSASESGTVISLAEAGSFPAGRADLTPAGLRVMRQVADLLRDQPFSIRVEGHTDDRPIHAAKYESNWELSTARASRVVEFLVTEGGLTPGRLSAAGYGEFRPRVPNDTRQARARNRRVDIVVLDAAVAQGTSSQADYRTVGTRPSDGR